MSKSLTNLDMILLLSYIYYVYSCKKEGDPCIMYYGWSDVHADSSDAEELGILRLSLSSIKAKVYFCQYFLFLLFLKILNFC